MSLVPSGLDSTTNADTFGGGWGSFADGLSGAFNSALDLGLKYEMYKQTKDNNGSGQADVINAVTKDSQPNVAPTSVNPTQGDDSSQWINGVDNKVVLITGGIVGALLLIKVKV